MRLAGPEATLSLLPHTFTSDAHGIPLGNRRRESQPHHSISDADEDKVEDAVVDVDEDGEAEPAAGRLQHALEQAGDCTAGEDTGQACMGQLFRTFGYLS